MLKGHLETTFNDLLDIKAVIGKETKDGGGLCCNSVGGHPVGK